MLDFLWNITTKINLNQYFKAKSGPKKCNITYYSSVILVTGLKMDV